MVRESGVPVRRVTAALISVFLMVGMVPSAGAEVTQQELADAETEIRELSGDLEGQRPRVDTGREQPAEHASVQQCAAQIQQ